MSFVRKKEAICEAHQLSGNAGETIAVCEWVARQGYPWLLGDANRPETLAPKGGRPGDPGIYIDPASGDLVLHTGKTSAHAGYGDWIVKHPVHGIQVHKQVFFDAMFEIVDGQN